MGRTWLKTVVCSACVCCSWASFQAQERSHGIPASVSSVGVDGRSHGIPASVVSPTFDGRTAGVGVPGRHLHHRRSFVTGYVPYAVVPYYGYEDPPPGPPPAAEVSAAPEAVDPPAKPHRKLAEDSEPAPKHVIVDDGAPAADRSTVAEKTDPQELPATSQAPAHSTTLIFRDGHRGEVRNYAILGQNLIDLTDPGLMKKIPLKSLDLPATQKENEEKGVEFRLP